MCSSAKAELETVDVQEAVQRTRNAGLKNEELTAVKVRGPQGNPQPST